MKQSDLTGSQLGFLRIHVRNVVDRWQWHFRGAQLRAHAGTQRATISSDELADLVTRGLMRRGGGVDVRPTEQAKALMQ